MIELIWDGKYDDKGGKVAPPSTILPLQIAKDDGRVAIQ